MFYNLGDPAVRVDDGTKSFDVDNNKQYHVQTLTLDASVVYTCKATPASDAAVVTETTVSYWKTGTS